MGGILNFFVDALDFNEGINFYAIFMCIVIYMVFFWVAVSVWVYTDAKKRYRSPKNAFWIAFAVFILFFPALILYLAVRKPYPEEYMDMLDFNDGGVNVPIVNFVGDKGIQMSFELNIHPDHDFSKNNNDMKVDVQWKSQNPNMKKIENSSNNEVNKPKKSDSKSGGLSSFLSGWKKKFKISMDSSDANKDKSNDSKTSQKNSDNKNNNNKDWKNKKKDWKNKKKDKKNKYKNKHNENNKQGNNNGSDNKGNGESN